MNPKEAREFLEQYKEKVDRTGLTTKETLQLSQALDWAIKKQLSPFKEIRQCMGCGAYRLYAWSEYEKGWVPAAGCMACDRIKMLEEIKIVYTRDSGRKKEMIRDALSEIEKIKWLEQQKSAIRRGKKSRGF